MRFTWQVTKDICTSKGQWTICSYLWYVPAGFISWSDSGIFLSFAYIPLPNLHTRFWRQQFPWRFMRHSPLRALLQPGVIKLYPCFPIGRSGISSFGFCNKFFFPVAGYQPAAQPPTWRTRGCSSSGLYPLTNPARLDLPGTAVPTGTALRVIEKHKLHHHDKVSAQGKALILHIRHIGK